MYVSHLRAFMHDTGLRHRSLGAYFPDLPSNMLGSFLMGLFAASGTLGIPNSKQLAILPESSNWQVAHSSPITCLSPHDVPSRLQL